MSVESEEDGIPETVLLAEGGLNALREMRALLRKHGNGRSFNETLTWLRHRLQGVPAR